MCKLIAVSEDGNIEIWEGKIEFKECLGNMEDLINGKRKLSNSIVFDNAEITKIDNIHSN